MLLHAANLVAVFVMWALMVALCVFGLWACAVVIRRHHRARLLLTFIVALALSMMVQQTLGWGGPLNTPDLAEGVEWLPAVINGLGVVLWCVIPRPSKGAAHPEVDS